jgi:glucose-6-phosphate 1-dehydrogenase
VEVLPEKFCIVGVARPGMSNYALRGSLRKGLHKLATRAVDDKIANRLLEYVTYAEADPSDPAPFDRLKERLEQLEAARNTSLRRAC